MREERKLKGVSIKSLTSIATISIIIYAIIIVVLIVEIIFTNTKVTQDTNDYTICSDALVEMKDASYYLTSQCRRFAESGNIKFMDSYFEEINTTQRREHAISQLEEYSIDLTNSQYRQALEASEELEVYERHAMKLLVVSLELDRFYDIPKPVQDYELTTMEIHLNKGGQRDRARMILYSDQYMNCQSKVTDNLEAFRASITQTLKEELEKSTNHHLLLINIFIVFLILLFASIFFAIIIIGDAVVNPINIFLECINNNIRMPLRGSIETQQMAIAYNTMFEKHMMYENDKKRVGQRDHLTGALNTIGFNETLYDIRHDSKKVALVLMEIDDFDVITKYHSKDSVSVILIEIYNILGMMTEYKDEVYRIDQGLYGVFIFGISSEDKDICADIYSKFISKLKESNISDDVTVSVGVAFSDISGYDNGLYNNANVALYQTKDRGGNDISFYEKE